MHDIFPGISILYQKPTKEPPSTFSFMSPFSTEVWLYVGGAYLSVSFCLFILGRISPTEWDNPYPCIEEPTELENQFTLRNSLWFTIGALLQQVFILNHLTKPIHNLFTTGIGNCAQVGPRWPVEISKWKWINCLVFPELYQLVP